MKIKNLAFYGVMAAILGSVGTARADDSTIIASKGYVDAYAQKQSDRVQTTWANTSNDVRSSTDKYPSMATLNDAVGNGVAGLDLAQVGETGKPIVTVSQTDGQVAATVGQITTAGINDSALTKNAAATELNNATTAADTKLPTTKAVATALAGKEDVANKQAAQTGDTVTRWSLTAAADSAGYASDTKYPTVKAVAQQIADINVSAAVQNGTNALELANAADKAPSVTAVKGIADDTTTTYTARDSNNQLTGAGSSTKVPTTKALVTALKDLDMAEISNQAQGENWEKAVTKISQVDGRVYATMGQIGSGGIATNAVKTTHIADNNVTFAKISDKTQAQTGTVVPWDTTANSDAPGYTPDDKFPTVKAVAQQIAAGAVTPNTAITPSSVNSIVTYDAKGLVTGGIKLDTTLNDINVTSGGSTCSASNPCVLSYIGNNTYRWTNMDTEGLNAATGS